MIHTTAYSLPTFMAVRIDDRPQYGQNKTWSYSIQLKKCDKKCLIINRTKHDHIGIVCLWCNSKKVNR